MLAMTKPLERGSLEAHVLRGSELASSDRDQLPGKEELCFLARVSVVPRAKALPMLLPVHPESDDPRLAALPDMAAASEIRRTLRHHRPSRRARTILKIWFSLRPTASAS